MAYEPEHIGKYHKKKEAADITLNTRLRHRRGAYDTAMDKALTDEKGNVHIDWLDKKENQEKFSKAMFNYFKDAANKELKSMGYDLDKKKFESLSKEEQEMHEYFVVNKFYNITKEQIDQIVKGSGKDLTMEGYTKTWVRQHQHAQQELYSAAASHLNEQHIEDILKYVQTAEGKPAHQYIKKDALRLDEAISLLVGYDKGKRKFTEEEISKTFPHAYKKDEKGEKKKKDNVSEPEQGQPKEHPEQQRRAA